MKDGFVVAGCTGSGHCNFVLHGVTYPRSRYLVEGDAYFLSVEGWWASHVLGIELNMLLCVCVCVFVCVCVCVRAGIPAVPPLMRTFQSARTHVCHKSYLSSQGHTVCVSQTHTCTYAPLISLVFILCKWNFDKCPEENGGETIYT